MINGYSFGLITVDGKSYQNDVIVFKDRVESWWRIEGHRVATVDIEKIAEAKPEIVVFGTGESRLMNVSKEAQDYLSQNNIKVITAETEEAVKRFNELSRKGKDIVGAFHLTC